MIICGLLLPLDDLLGLLDDLLLRRLLLLLWLSLLCRSGWCGRC